MIIVFFKERFWALFFFHYALGDVEYNCYVDDAHLMSSTFCLPSWGHAHEMLGTFWTRQCRTDDKGSFYRLLAYITATLPSSLGFSKGCGRDWITTLIANLLLPLLDFCGPVTCLLSCTYPNTSRNCISFYIPIKTWSNNLLLLFFNYLNVPNNKSGEDVFWPLATNPLFDLERKDERRWNQMSLLFNDASFNLG